MWCMIYTMRRTNIYLSETQMRKLHELSEKLDLSTSEIIRRAIDSYLERELSKGEKDGPKEGC